MKLLVSHKNEIAKIIEEHGYTISDFTFISNHYGEQFVLKCNSNIVFMYRDSMSDGLFCDMFYYPANTNETSLYIECDSFEESKKHINLWLEYIKQELNTIDLWELEANK